VGVITFIRFPDRMIVESWPRREGTPRERGAPRWNLSQQWTRYSMFNGSA